MDMFWAKTLPKHIESIEQFHIMVQLPKESVSLCVRVCFDLKLKACMINMLMLCVGFLRLLNSMRKWPKHNSCVSSIHGDAFCGGCRKAISTNPRESNSAPKHLLISTSRILPKTTYSQNLKSPKTEPQK